MVKLVRGKLPLRVALMLLAFSVIAPAALSLPRTTEAQEANSPIAAAALRRLGTQGGQCWTFMQEVVAEGSGRRVGFDYRAGFFEAGAVEVSAEEAANGDIIQIASDGNTGAWASYPGLHTSVVLKNLGNNRFDVIDSNQNWDEMVRLRPNYDPYAAAARNGLQVHIYRIPLSDAPALPASASAPTTAVELAAGDTATVAAGGDCLNLRSGASTTSSRIACLPTGTQVTATGETKTSGGMTWVQVETSKGVGWMAANFLAKTASAVEAEPAPGAEPPPIEPEPAAAPAPAAVLADAPPSPAAAGASASLPTAQVDNSPGCLRVRSSAGTSGAIKDCLPAATAVTLLDEVPVTANGYTWMRVRVGERVEGWVASDFLIRS